MISTEQALAAVAAARAEARKLGRNVTITIVDAAGLPLVLERMTGAGRLTAVIADAKANTAVLAGRDPAPLANLMNDYPSLSATLAARYPGRFAPMLGGVVIKQGDDVLGAIGVSGATAEEDDQIGRAALAVLLG